jgi:hypothetical protein
VVAALADAIHDAVDTAFEGRIRSRIAPEQSRQLPFIPRVDNPHTPALRA